MASQTHDTEQRGLGYDRPRRGVHWLVALALSMTVSIGVTAPWLARALDARSQANPAAGLASP